MRILILTALALILTISAPPQLGAQQVSEAFRSTAYPLPRYVSLRSDEVFVRTGPGQKYPVLWVFKKKALPVEITLEYDIWRKIKDFEGQQGWVHKSLLSGNRTALTVGNDMLSLQRKPSKNSRLLAYLEPSLLVDVDECEKQWCRINASGYRGWLEKTALWGVYEHEEFD